ncbi:hypothetical protein J8F10_29695 [Gemmata sp. G18]|uniref:Uncharacterized protein n=1 Tax=Gemmata palustris TaxID=2822762 RepID=A0ABS5C0C1_9BACT|nr:hypothetical protein [Gemmata palustris]MBP3959438.1 hypothetical protein [Gemmata palustris]
MSTSKATKKTTPKSKKSTTSAKAQKPTSAELLFDPPHPVWDTPVNARLGKLLVLVEQARGQIDEFVNDVQEFPDGMFTEFGDEFMTRLRGLSLVMFDQLCMFNSHRLQTNAEFTKWRTGPRSA